MKHLFIPGEMIIKKGSIVNFDTFYVGNIAKDGIDHHFIEHPEFHRVIESDLQNYLPRRHPFPETLPFMANEDIHDLFVPLFYEQYYIFDTNEDASLLELGTEPRWFLVIIFKEIHRFYGGVIKTTALEIVEIIQDLEVKYRDTTEGLSYYFTPITKKQAGVLNFYQDLLNNSNA